MCFINKNFLIKQLPKVKLLFTFFCIIVLLTFQDARSEILFSETFENNSNNWIIDTKNGSAWEIGQPIAVNVSSKSSITCAATLLNESYYPNSDSRLITPQISLDSIAYNQEVFLYFYQYYKFGDGHDLGQVKLQYYDNFSGEWSNWIVLYQTYESYAHWHESRIDLSKYAGKQIKIAFAHNSDGDSYIDAGWFVDDIEIIKNTIPVPEDLPFQEDFETDNHTWRTNRGLWEIGSPTNSGINPYSGSNCAVTDLANDYPKYIDSMLISPPINLPNISYTEEIILKLWQYYKFGDGHDIGQIKLQYFDDFSKTWSSWSLLLQTYESYAHWHESHIDVSSYAGKQIRIAFAHYADEDDYVDIGWYVDDISIIKSTIPNPKELPFQENFETDNHTWRTNRGLWDIGIPINSDINPHSGSNCAVTDLAKNYPKHIDSMLISPSINLPNISYTEEIILTLWQYYKFGDGHDIGQIKLQYFDDFSKTWSSWSLLLQTYESYAHWHESRIDVSSYAGKRIRIAFAHYADEDGYVDIGWYIDDISIKKSTIPNPKELPFQDNFETDNHTWRTNRGLWEIGIPTNTGIIPHSGSNCAVTDLASDYPRHIDSMLISPSINLPNISYTEEITLKLWQYYKFGDGHDFGQIKLQYFYNNSKKWSGWKLLLQTYESYAHWHESRIDISSYAGKIIRIAFTHYADEDGYVDVGWFIDDISIIKATIPNPKELPFQEDFETDNHTWRTNRGLWEIGVPTNSGINPHSGNNCVVTGLASDYPRHIDSMLISPSINLPNISYTEEITLKLWQYYKFGDGHDFGQIKLQYFDNNSQTWSGWALLLQTYESYANWHESRIDISSYAGKQIRIAFTHYADEDSYVDIGWFIDDINIQKNDIQQPYHLPFFENFESETKTWFADRGIWEIGFPKDVGINNHRDTKCAATKLQGPYPPHINSQLISPTIQMPSLSVNEDITLSIWHCYSFGDSHDGGSIRVQYYNSNNKQWSGWQQIYATSDNQGIWHELSLNLNSYSNKLIRLSFFHVSDEDSYTHYGWNIDDIAIAGPNIGSLFGKILTTIDDIEVPVENCSISILNSNIEVKTDINGSFIISDIPLGIYSLRLYKQGFKPIIIPKVELRNNDVLELSNISMHSVGCGLKGDINSNNLIGLEEAIHALKVTSGILRKDEN